MLEKGEKVLIRTVTHYYTGQIEQVDERFVALSDAAWIADTGRFSTALETGTLNEVEPFPDGVRVAVAGIIDVAPWAHDLPRTQK